jgi:hypothetical protein
MLANHVDPIRPTGKRKNMHSLVADSACGHLWVGGPALGHWGQATATTRLTAVPVMLSITAHPTRLCRQGYYSSALTARPPQTDKPLPYRNAFQVIAAVATTTTMSLCEHPDPCPGKQTCRTKRRRPKSVSGTQPPQPSDLQIQAGPEAAATHTHTPKVPPPSWRRSSGSLASSAASTQA